MYYVAKLYKSTTPLIIECFNNIEDAMNYATIMHRSGKGDYTVLRPLTTKEVEEAE